MASIFNLVKRPEYVFRPSQIGVRFKRFSKAPVPRETVTLPWGAPVTVHLNDHVSSEIIWYGIFDKIVPESIARLLDTGETGIDIGANIGQNCFIMAAVSGPTGVVEPHPETFKELEQNHRQWPTDGFAPIRLEQVALGPEERTARLIDGEDFGSNRGGTHSDDEGDASSGAHNVQMKRLDDYLLDRPAPCVVKIDVEGAELQVLQGGCESLKQRRIRDLIFEDFEHQPNRLTDHLRDAGFTLFALLPRWFGPSLISLDEKWSAPTSFSYNFLATLDPERARRRFRPRGWYCLKSGGYWKRRRPRA
jgi:FkbM family methyltransferase